VNERGRVASEKDESIPLADGLKPGLAAPTIRLVDLADEVRWPVNRAG